MKKVHSVFFTQPVSVQVAERASRHVGTYNEGNEAYQGWTLELVDGFVVIHTATPYTTCVPLHMCKQITFKAAPLADSAQSGEKRVK